LRRHQRQFLTTVVPRAPLARSKVLVDGMPVVSPASKLDVLDGRRPAGGGRHDVMELMRRDKPARWNG
jgi:hypothetical protein